MNTCPTCGCELIPIPTHILSEEGITPCGAFLVCARCVGAA